MEALIAETLGGSEVQRFTFERGAGLLHLGLSDRHGENSLKPLGFETRDFSPMEYMSEGDLEDLGEFLRPVLEEHRPTKVRLGPAGRGTLETMARILERCDDYVWSVDSYAMEAVLTPAGVDEACRKHRRSCAKFATGTFRPEEDGPFPEEARALHAARWGENRSEPFFRFLTGLIDGGHAYVCSLRRDDGAFLGTNVDILLPDRTLQYYCVSDHQDHSGTGIFLLMQSILAWRRRAAGAAGLVYSFGRGGEPYKFRMADRYRVLYELKGHYKNGAASITA